MKKPAILPMDGKTFYCLKDFKKVEIVKKNFEKLIKSYTSFYKNNRKPTRLLSEYGEILVQEHLIKDFDIEIPGGQTKYDLSIINKKTKTRKYVEVKTSSYKNEQEYGNGWGNALNWKKCKEHGVKDFCYFDYLVFVAIKEKSLDSEFYIFDTQDIEKNKKFLINKSSRFTKSSHRIWIPSKPYNEARAFDKSLFHNKNYFKRWDKIQ